MESKSFSMTRKDLVEGIHKCLANVCEILDKTHLIVIDKEDNSITLGLYSFAIEEYGKALLLKDYLKEQKERYEIPIEIFKGTKSHYLKFEKAFSALPSECKNFVPGVRVVIPDPHTRTIDVTPKGDKVSVGQYWTGTFTVSGDFPTDFETRMTCFYIDWDDAKKQWKTKPRTIADGINRGILCFKKEIVSLTQELSNNS